MAICRKRSCLVALVTLATACGGSDEGVPDSPVGAGEPSEASIDQRSYRLGSIGAFAEMVDAGVKELALSAAVDPEEMDALVGEAERIVKDHNVQIFRETDFLVTDLFSEELTDGKEVLLIYRGETLQRYQDLKAAKKNLLEQSAYEGEARREIARRFGGLLSYSDDKIAALLAGGNSSH